METWKENDLPFKYLVVFYLMCAVDGEGSANLELRGIMKSQIKHVILEGTY